VKLPALAAERRAAAPLLLSAGNCRWYAALAPAAVDRYLLPAVTCRLLLLLSIDGIDGRTDR